jgi:hypothetical protein
MRTEKQNLAWKEENFKESKKTKGHRFYDFSSHESYTEEAKFVKT